MIKSEEAVFSALADPNRRAIIDILTDDGALTATQLAEVLDITRQGITKHLKIMTEAGVLTRTQQGRDKYYYVNPEPMREASLWMTTVAAHWDQRLDRLRSLVEDEEDSGDG